LEEALRAAFAPYLAAAESSSRAEETQKKWRTWWVPNAKDVRVYRPDDCPDRSGLPSIWASSDLCSPLPLSTAPSVVQPQVQELLDPRADPLDFALR